MFTKIPTPQSIITNKRASRRCALVLTALGTSLLTTLSMTSISANAAGLNDLFDNGSAQSKFLPVDDAFQVSALYKKPLFDALLFIKNNYKDISFL